MFLFAMIEKKRGNANQMRRCALSRGMEKIKSNVLIYLVNLPKGLLTV